MPAHPSGWLVRADYCGLVSGTAEPDEEAHGPDFGRMIEALRLVQERITTASAPHDVVTETADTLEKLAATAEGLFVELRPGQA